MYISKYQAHLVDMKLLDGNHHPKYNLELMVFHTLNSLDSMHMFPYNDKLDLNLHLIDILRSIHKQLKHMD